tara:strand:+ start:90 stop:1034 length:945 start_codon:yes stop_codon:yes gene_type:complete
MKKNKLNMFNYKTFNNFFIFFLISILFSTIVKLTKVYTKNISYKINLTEIPDDKIIINQSADSLKLTISSFGFDFIKYYLSNQTINISSKDILDNSQSYVITQSNNYSQIDNFINPDFELVSINFDSIFFDYDKLGTKNVPVVLNSSINFSQGFDYFKDFNLLPDSISVIGSEKALNSINLINTKELVLDDIKSSVTQNLELDISNTNNLKYSDKSVKIFIDVEKSTESILNLPVSIINIPTDININYYPKTIKVSFSVSLDNYQKYSSKDFKIICDFNEISQDGKLTAEIINQPKLIKNIRMMNNEIQYVYLK